jgi:hypothetical protein
VDEAEKLVNDYLAATSKLSTGEAAKRSGIPKSTIADLRNGKRPNFQPKTWRKIEEYVEANRPGSSGTGNNGNGDLEALIQELATASPSERRRLLYLLRALRAADTGEVEPPGQ